VQACDGGGDETPIELNGYYNELDLTESLLDELEGDYVKGGGGGGGGGGKGGVNVYTKCYDVMIYSAAVEQYVAVQQEII
jgi:hypothetical protein